MSHDSEGIPGAFPIVLPRDEPGRAQLLAKLEHWAAISKPTFVDMRFDFKPSRRFEQIAYPLDRSTLVPKIFDNSPGTLPHTPWDYCESGCPHFPVRPRRERPAVFDSHKSRTLAVTLTEPLQIGVGSASQVYKARAHDKGTSTPSEVVVKIYQMSRVGTRGDLAGLLGAAGRAGRDWCNVLQSFRTECSAYKHMEDIQGSHIPYVHGFFHITLPHGEPSIAVVMEYIPGQTLRQYAAAHASAPSPSIVDAVGDSMAMVTHAVTMKGISVKDWRSDNFLVTSELEVVHIDFGWFIPMSKVHRFEMLENIVSALKGAGFDKASVSDWIVRRLTVTGHGDTTRKAPFVDAFDVPMNLSDPGRIWRRLGVITRSTQDFKEARSTQVPSV